MVGGLVLKVGVVVLVREEGAAQQGIVFLLKGSRLKKDILWGIKMSFFQQLPFFLFLCRL